MDSKQDKAIARILDIARLESQLSQNPWLKPMVFSQVTSTNDIVIENLNYVVPSHGIVVVADEQTQGRGRLDRKWTTPAGGAIAMSLGIDQSDLNIELTAVPLVVGVAVRRALANLEISVELKWPNDIIFSSPTMRKVGGILVQLVNGKFIIGIGINVDLDKSELPTAVATSLSLEGFKIDRIDLTCAIVEQISTLRNADNNWFAEYLEVCSTIGREVKVRGLNGTEITGQAVGISTSGALEIKNLENLYQITVGDIEHLEVAAD